jgi:hypothetical protein
MRMVWVLTLGLVSLVAVQGCKQKPEPIPGPKASIGMAVPNGHTPGIAWFQGSFDEAFAQADIPQHCRGEYFAAPRAPEMIRSRKRSNSAALPTVPAPRLRHRLV